MKMKGTHELPPRQWFSGSLLLLCLLLFSAFGAALLASCRQEMVPLLEQKCGTCHDAQIVYDSRYTENGWRQVIHGMKVRGLELTPGEERRIMEILMRDYSL